MSIFNIQAFRKIKKLQDKWWCCKEGILLFVGLLIFDEMKTWCLIIIIFSFPRNRLEQTIIQ